MSFAGQLHIGTLSVSLWIWSAHGAGAVRIGFELLGAGTAALIHAAVPGWFTQSAGKTVSRIYNHIQSRRAGAADPESWPDYEI